MPSGPGPEGGGLLLAPASAPGSSGSVAQPGFQTLPHPERTWRVPPCVGRW